MHAPLDAASSEPRLDVRAVHLWRGEKHLLRGISFTLSCGELLQVVGPNGVGKTSLLRCTAGLLPTESGEITWRGQPLHDCRDEFHHALAYLAHTNALKSDLTAMENLRYGAALKRTLPKEDLEQALAQVQIRHCSDLPARALSAGQKRRLAIARILLADAPLWILDEPITNLDAAGISLFEQCMSDHLANGGMILSAAHQSLLQGRPNVRTLELH